MTPGKYERVEVPPTPYARLLKLNFKTIWRDLYVGKVAVVQEYRPDQTLCFLLNFGEEAFWCRPEEVELMEELPA